METLACILSFDGPFFSWIFSLSTVYIYFARYLAKATTGGECFSIELATDGKFFDVSLYIHGRDEIECPDWRRALSRLENWLPYYSIIDSITVVVVFSVSSKILMNNWRDPLCPHKYFFVNPADSNASQRNWRVVFNWIEIDRSVRSVAFEKSRSIADVKCVSLRVCREERTGVDPTASL